MIGPAAINLTYHVSRSVIKLSIASHTKMKASNSREDTSSRRLDTLMNLNRVQQVSANRPSSGKSSSVPPCTQEAKDKEEFVLAWNRKRSAVNEKWTKKQQRTTTLAPGKAMMTQLHVVVTV